MFLKNCWDAFMEDKHLIDAQQVAAAVPVRKAHQIGLA
jgi:hypothetical protein